MKRGRKKKSQDELPTTIGSSEGFRIACWGNRKGEHLSTCSCPHCSRASSWSVYSLVLPHLGMHEHGMVWQVSKDMASERAWGWKQVMHWGELRSSNKQLHMQVLFPRYKSHYAMPMLKKRHGFIKTKLLSIIPNNSLGSPIWSFKSESSFFLRDPVLFTVSEKGTYRSPSLLKYTWYNRKTKSKLIKIGIKI